MAFLLRKNNKHQRKTRELKEDKMHVLKCHKLFKPKAISVMKPNRYKMAVDFFRLALQKSFLIIRVKQCWDMRYKSLTVLWIGERVLR